MKVPPGRFSVLKKKFFLFFWSFRWQSLNRFSTMAYVLRKCVRRFDLRVFSEVSCWHTIFRRGIGIADATGVLLTVADGVRAAILSPISKLKQIWGSWNRWSFIIWKVLFPVLFSSFFLFSKNCSAAMAKS